MSKKLTTEQDLTIFNALKIRRTFDKTQQKWFFSVIDIMAILTEKTDYKKAKNYWNVLKHRLSKEKSQVVTNCKQLKLTASDGKKYLTDVADVQTLLRIIQSVPNKKAEPIKLWLAKVGNERIQELSDPEQSLNRARDNWQKSGRSKKWIERRMSGQETRNKLTDYWQENQVKEGQEFAILTNIIHSEWSGLSVADHKALKNLDSQNLRDHMSEAELIFTALAELSTRQIAENDQAIGFAENKQSARKGGTIARNARKELEQTTKKKIVDKANFLNPNRLDEA